MIVDCDRCAVRGGACQDCVITVLFGAPPSGVGMDGGVELDGPGRQALDTMVGVGRLSQLQLVHRYPDGAERPATDGERSTRHAS
jgi:hypothetical protein